MSHYPKSVVLEYKSVLDVIAKILIHPEVWTEPDENDPERWGRCLIQVNSSVETWYKIKIQSNEMKLMLQDLFNQAILDAIIKDAQDNLGMKPEISLVPTPEYTIL